MAGPIDFEMLVEQHQAALYRFALSLTRNESDACDLVQETFYIWAAKGHQLADASKAKSWLFTTLHREFLADRRHQTRFPHHELEEAQAELPELPPVFPGGLDAQVVLDCLARMDAVFRAPVALFYLSDHSYPEIAQILEVPLGTVKSRMARGLAQLQGMLVDSLPRKSPATAPTRSPAGPPNPSMPPKPESDSP
jgi:RNA polymerase sigma-70 factor (ECF subfamily)